LRNEGVGLGPGDLAVKLHIPEAGPFTEAAVTESLRAAKRLLRKYFGEERFAACVCVSWLLDPQLAEYLPPTSNIVAFQRLFRIGPAKDDDGDASVRKFVFGNAEAPLDELPQMSSLHRAAVAHWRRGKHWRVHVGRLP
jgi:hypothetical protein